MKEKIKNNYLGEEKIYKLMLKFSIPCIMSLLISALNNIVDQIFIGKGDTLYNEFATMTFRIFLSRVTFTCVIKMTSIFFQAVGQPVKAAISSLTRDIVCFIPLVIILPKFFGVTGILFAAPAADFILKDRDNVLRIFIHGPKEYRIQEIMEMYDDTFEEAKHNLVHSDKATATL